MQKAKSPEEAKTMDPVSRRIRSSRLVAVEETIQGRRRTEVTASAAGEVAIEGAVPLQHDAYRVPLLRNLVKRAVQGREDT